MTTTPTFDPTHQLPVGTRVQTNQGIGTTLEANHATAASHERV